MRRSALLCTIFALIVNAPIATHAQNTACDRACLEGFVNQYLEALVARDPSRLPLTRTAKYTENGVQLKLGDGMWGPKIAMGSYKLYFADPKAGQRRLGASGEYAVRWPFSFLICVQDSRRQAPADRSAGRADTLRDADRLGRHGQHQRVTLHLAHPAAAHVNPTGPCTRHRHRHRAAQFDSCARRRRIARRSPPRPPYAACHRPAP